MVLLVQIDGSKHFTLGIWHMNKLILILSLSACVHRCIQILGHLSSSQTFCCQCRRVIIGVGVAAGLILLVVVFLFVSKGKLISFI